MTLESKLKEIVVLKEEYLQFMKDEIMQKLPEVGITLPGIEEKIKKSIPIEPLEVLKKPFESLYEIEKPELPSVIIQEAFKKLTEQIVIIRENEEILKEAEEVILRKEYWGITSYPPEVEEILKIRRIVKEMPYENKIKTMLLDRSLKLLEIYLSKGGILSLKDLKEFILDFDLGKYGAEKNLSIILPSLGFTKEEIREFHNLVERITSKWPREPPGYREILKTQLINESILHYFLGIYKLSNER